MVEFIPFPKVPRLRRECIVTEKIDGTNAAVQIVPLPAAPGPYTVIVGDFAIFAQSRNRFITPSSDNYGFASWVAEHAPDLVNLGPGCHFGEWWGRGIQRGYGLSERRFSLFNVSRWRTERPGCCDVVPVLWSGIFDEAFINGVFTTLGTNGSSAAPGFMKPEGIMIFHTAAGNMFKRTFECDAAGKEAA